MTDFSPKKLRARFQTLHKKRGALVAEIAPVQAEYDAGRMKVDEARTALAEVRSKLTDAKAPLVEIDREIAIISRALAGKTGPIEE